MARRDVCPRPGAVKFFEREAGYRRAPGEAPHVARRLGARDLAVAECVADREGAIVEWEHDTEPYDPGDSDYQPDEVLCATLKSRDGEVLASLCSIGDPTRQYARVVEAELKLEAFGNLVEPIVDQLNVRRGRPIKLGLNRSR